jgi:hypothetical protein
VDGGHLFWFALILCSIIAAGFTTLVSRLDRIARLIESLHKDLQPLLNEASDRKRDSERQERLRDAGLLP